jgi:hypothetical protein
VTNAQALVALTKRFAKRGEQPYWSVQDRSWERHLYVSWELGDYRPLTWTVGYDGKVMADAETRVVLTGALRAPAPTPTTLPSLPPGL